MADTYNPNVLARLQDSSKLYFTEDEVDTALDIAYQEVTDACPLEETESLLTVEDSFLLDASGITGLRAGWTQQSFHPIFGVEWPIETDDGDPYPPTSRKYRTYNIIGTDIEMVLDTAPDEDDETVYVRCFKVHTATSIANRPDLLPILIDIAAGHAAISKKFNPLVDYFSSRGGLFDSILRAIGEVEVALSEAVEDTTEGGKKIEEFRGVANKIIEKMSPRIEKAMADIATARTFFNSVAIGMPQREYLQSAGNEIQVAATELRQASAYLSQEGAAASYRAQAGAAFQRANTAMGKARTYFDMIRAKGTVVDVSRHLKVDGDYLLQMARSRLARKAMRKIAPKRDWPRS